MKDRCPAARRAVGIVRWMIILLASLINPTTTANNCHLSRSATTKDFSQANQNTTYCEPSKGCTFIAEYEDCISDNETPKCVFYNVQDEKCHLCYKDGKNEKPPGGASSSEPQNKTNSETIEFQKMPPGAKLCDLIPP